VTAFGNLH